jgi:hypothetical protein
MTYARFLAHLGPPSMRVEPGRITLADGTVITRGLFNNQLGNHALAHAIRIARGGDVIAVRGAHPGFKVGSANQGDADNAPVIVRPNFDPQPPLAIVGDPDAPERPRIEGGIQIAGTPSPDRGGIEDLTLAGLDLLNGRNDKFNVIVTQTTRTGRLCVAHCRLLSLDPTAWMGFGKVWAIRPHGNLEDLDVTDNEFSEALEHAVVYPDNAGWGGGQITIERNRVTGRGGNRTCVQITNRVISGPAGGGRLRIADNDFRCTAGDQSSGGGCITIAGHPGPVRLVRNKVTLDGNHSGVIVWSDAGKGLHLTPDGFTTESVHIDGLEVTGGRRPHVQIAGAGRVTIVESFRLRSANNDGARVCIDLDEPQYGGPIKNGVVEFVSERGKVSDYSGFASGAKVRRAGKILSDAQIDAMVRA